MKKVLSISFIVLLTLGLLVPYTQHKLKFAKPTGLNGYYKKTNIQAPVLTLKSFQSGEFQKNFQLYWNENIGFKNFFIRLKNQVDYSVFNKLNAQSSVLGKDNYMLPEGDIKAFLGKDFIGSTRINAFIEKMAATQAILKERGIFFTVLIAPSKASLYSDAIPSKYYSLYGRDSTNYDLIKKGLIEYKINHFDAREIILNDESYFEHPAYPKAGVHWSGNTVAKIADTLVEYLEKEGGLPMPDIELYDGEITVKDYRFTDYDIGEAMNVFWHVSDDELHYPKMEFKNVKNKKPTILGVGDSFIQSFFGFYPVLDSIFSQQSNVWYYNEIMGWPLNYNIESIPVIKLDMAIEMQNRDAIVLEMTEENLKTVGYGFIEKLNEHLTNPFVINENLQSLFEELKNDEEINAEAVKLAPIVGYTVEEMRSSLIKSKLQNKWLLNFDYEAEVEKVIQGIMASEGWLNSVKEKAIQWNIPLEEAIRKDAVWMVNSKLGKN